MVKKITFISVLFLLNAPALFAQCIDGTQPECTCETATVLCSIDELDGYVFSMSNFLHSNDGPTPICPNSQSQTDNPTWFAFTAWCEDLTLEASFSHCIEVGGYIGVQIAIFEDCTFTNAVACNIDVNDCNTNSKILAMNGLNIGSTYYFLVDGCLGSYCDVTIDIIGVCGEEVIALWTEPIEGATNPCIGSLETYSVEDLDGAGTYHWFVDGILVEETIDNDFEMVWQNAGTYELCIDVSNAPCVPIDNDPTSLCATIVVNEVEAGDLIINSTLLCPSELATITSTAYADSDITSQVLFIADDSGVIIEIFNTDSGIFTSDIPGTFTIYVYNYITANGTSLAVGDNISAIDCTANCCDLESIEITFDNIEATISNIECYNNETGNDDSDDTFSFDILVNGQSADLTWQSTDGILSGNYGNVYNFENFLVSDGALNFEIQATNTPTCVTSISINPPNSCSECPQSIEAGAAQILDCNAPTATLSAASLGNGTYTWSGPNSFSNNTLMPTVVDSGWYYLTGAFIDNCVFVDSVLVEKNMEVPDANAGLDQILDCYASPVLLEGMTNASGNLAYEWTNANGGIVSTQLQTMVTTTGIYTLQVTDLDNGCSSIDEMLVNLDPADLQFVSAQLSPEICAGEENGLITISEIVGGAAPYTFTLNGGPDNTTGQFSNLGPSLYDIQIADIDGCTLDTSFTINAGVGLEIILPDTLEIEIGSVGAINAMVNIPITDLASIQWNPIGFLFCDTCLSTTIQSEEDVNFQLTIIHENGCVETAALNFISLPQIGIYIPNVFSPNSDGTNDSFTLFANERVEEILELSIFDRWGNQVFQRQNFAPNTANLGWNGKHRAKKMENGVYAYFFKVLIDNGAQKVISGTVSLLK